MWDVVAVDKTVVDKTAAGRLVAVQAADRRAAALAVDRWIAASAAAWGLQSWATDERANGTITVIITVGFPIT